VAARIDMNDMRHRAPFLARSHAARGELGVLGLMALRIAAILFVWASGTAAQTASAPAREHSGMVRALVVGIDNYKNGHIAPPLSGAVADARDINAALQQAGASDITLLLDDQATRSRLEIALNGLAQRSRPGDLVIITFAGHGTRGAERVPGSEPDGKDEWFVLWGFGTSGGDTRERLVDDEMADWLGRLDASGARTIFLADVCHGGGITKAPDAFAGRSRLRYIHPADSAAGATRGAYFIAPGEDKLTLPVEVPADDDATQRYPSLTFIAGAPDTALVPEFDIPGVPTPRGAASYAFARALEGRADLRANRDGMTTRGELMAFLNAEIGMVSGGVQDFVFEPSDAASSDFVLFGRNATGSAAVASFAAPAGSAQQPVIGGPAIHTPSSGHTATGAPPTLQFVYIDHASGNVVSRKRGVRAYGLPPDELQVAAERFEVEERFAEMRREMPLTVSLRPAARSFAEGERFGIAVAGVQGSNLILLNLSEAGKIQYLYPRGAVSSLQTEDTATFTIQAAAPFGSDAMIVIATRGRRTQLEAELQMIDGKSSVMTAWEIVTHHLDTKDRLGVVSYLTSARARR